MEYDWETGLVWHSVSSSIGITDTDLNCIWTGTITATGSDAEGIGVGRGHVGIADDARTTLNIGIYTKPEPVGSFYGEIYAHEGSATQELTTTGTYYQITQFTANGDSNGVTADHTGDDLTILYGGTYLVTVSISFNGTANSTYHCSIHVDGVEQEDLELDRRLGAGGDTGNAGITGLLVLASDEVVDLRCEGDSNGDDIAVTSVNLSVMSIN